MTTLTHMAQLYFKYGAMGSSKSANALMARFNYEERGQKTLMVKPQLDNRDGARTVLSRCGLSTECVFMEEVPGMDLSGYDCVIVDEAQFLTPAHIEQLRDIVDNYNVPVFCFGLRTDFRTKMFPGSARLFELADSVSELKTVCTCGGKAMVNARIDGNGNIVTLDCCATRLRVTVKDESLVMDDLPNYSLAALAPDVPCVTRAFISLDPGPFGSFVLSPFA